MLRISGYVVCGLTLGVLCVSAARVSAQEEVLSQFYGSGVHNYWDRDYNAAMRELSAAIDGGSRDPRAYYYRGLAHMRMGNSQAAAGDLKKGAELESADVDQFYPVGKSLERVQGSERSSLERYRSLARAQVRQRQVRREQARYEQRRRSEAQVLRSVPLGMPPAPLQPPVVAPAAATEPLPQPAGEAGAPPVAQPPAADKPEPSPFDETPAKPADEKPAATDDPFDDAAGKSDAEAKSDTAPAKEEDPFGDEPK